MARKTKPNRRTGNRSVPPVYKHYNIRPRPMAETPPDTRPAAYIRPRVVTCGFILSRRARPVHSLTHTTLAAPTTVDTPTSHTAGEMPTGGTAQTHLRPRSARDNRGTDGERVKSVKGMEYITGFGGGVWRGRHRPVGQVDILDLFSYPRTRIPVRSPFPHSFHTPIPFPPLHAIREASLDPFKSVFPSSSFVPSHALSLTNHCFSIPHQTHAGCCPSSMVSKADQKRIKKTPVPSRRAQQLLRSNWEFLAGSPPQVSWLMSWKVGTVGTILVHHSTFNLQVLWFRRAHEHSTLDCSDGCVFVLVHIHRAVVSNAAQCRCTTTHGPTSLRAYSSTAESNRRATNLEPAQRSG